MRQSGASAPGTSEIAHTPSDVDSDTITETRSASDNSANAGTIPSRAASVGDWLGPLTVETSTVVEVVEVVVVVVVVSINVVELSRMFGSVVVEVAALPEHAANTTHGPSNTNKRRFMLI
jgi:hypothetical protein